MNPRDRLLADTRRIFADFGDLLTLERYREFQANIVGSIGLLIEWQSRIEDQTPSPSSYPAGSLDSKLSSYSLNSEIPISLLESANHDAWIGGGYERNRLRLQPQELLVGDQSQTERTLCHQQPLKWRNNMKAAIYAYAAALDLTMPTLIDQQILKCREQIANKGWTVCEDYIRSDFGIAPERKGLLSLVAAATLNPRPFDCVVMVDTSKLGRTIKVFNVIERFHHSGVFLYFTSENVDTGDLASIPTTLYCMIDDSHLSKLAAKAHRNQQRRARQGIFPRGECYGYSKMPIDNHSHRNECVHPPFVGDRLEIKESEAEAVRRIFDLFGSGAYTLREIVRVLDDHGISPPKSRKGSLNAGWTAALLYSILHNELYRGIILSNGTRTVLHHETGEIEVISRPLSGWSMVKNEDVRIVSEEQWEKVERVINSRRPTAPNFNPGIITKLTRKVRMLMNLLRRAGGQRRKQ